MAFTIVETHSDSASHYVPQAGSEARAGGEIWLDNRITAEVMKAFAKTSYGPRRDKPLLSDREKEIVQPVAQGYRNKEIGGKLFISEQTVKNHLHNIFDKLGVSDRLELALYAIHHRVIEQELPTSR